MIYIQWTSLTLTFDIYEFILCICSIVCLLICVRPGDCHSPHTSHEEKNLKKEACLLKRPIVYRF